MASLVFNQGTSADAIAKAMVEKFDAALNKVSRSVKPRVKELIRDAIEETPEYEAIATGRLWHMLGLENPGPVLLKIISAVQESVDVDYTPLRLNSFSIDGGLDIRVLRGDFSEVLSVPEASYISPERGFKIDWLEWLLKAGENTIIADYHYVPVPSPASRTGIGVMSRGGSWRIPAEYAGTESDNFLTRALDSVVPDMEQLFVAELKRLF